MADGQHGGTASSLIAKITGYITDIKGTLALPPETQGLVLKELEAFIKARKGIIGYSDQFGFEYKYKPDDLTASPFLSSFPSGCFFRLEEDGEETLHYEISLSRLLFYGIIYALFLGVLLPFFGAPAETFRYIALGGMGTVWIIRLLQIKKFKQFLQKVEKRELLDQYE